MKKTLIALLAATSCAMGSTLNSTYTGNYNTTTHGFTLTLSSSELILKDTDPALSSTVILESFTLKGCNSGTGANVEYGFVVLNNTTNEVLGLSTSTQTSGQNINTSFSFTNTSGTALTLNTADTYRFLTVSSAVLTLFHDSSKSYIYNAGGTGPPTQSVNGNTITISQGLTAPGIRGMYVASGATNDGCTMIFGANGKNEGSITVENVTGTLSPVFVNISVKNIPEPTTATLSLLALAGLAARRR